MDTWELPEVGELPDALLEFGVPFEDVNPLLAVRSRLARDSGLRVAFDRALAEQVETIGMLGHRPPGLPATWPENVSAAEGRYLAVLLFVAMAPYTRAWHRRRGIGAEVTRPTLADLGRQLTAAHRRGRGGGLAKPSWLGLHFRGELYQLGRLQFQRNRLAGAEADLVRAAGRNEWSLELHVPDFRGPLTPRSYEHSLNLAEEFFGRHFPEEPYESVCVYSWLLDRQLARHLPADSNIVRFQQRFTDLRPLRAPEDGNPLRFVFGRDDQPLESLPRDTSVQRAVVDHLLAGGHWYVAGGWAPFPEPGSEKSRPS